MLVTPTGVEWMTKNLPRKLSEVESFMARASKEMAFNKISFDSKPSLAVFNFDSNLFINYSNMEFTSNPVLSGQTIRRGWIHSGKNAASSGLKHLEHSQTE
jgi:hypothetical protein